MWEEFMSSKEKYRVKAITRRRVLEAGLAGSAVVVAPAFVRQALAEGPI
jgi:hypothetical protein